MLFRHPDAHLQSVDSDVTFLWLECNPGPSTCRGLTGITANSTWNRTKLHKASVLVSSKTKPFSYTLHVVVHLLAYQDTSKDSKVLFSILNKLFSKKEKSLYFTFFGKGRKDLVLHLAQYHCINSCLKMIACAFHKASSPRCASCFIFFPLKNPNSVVMQDCRLVLFPIATDRICLKLELLPLL